MEAFEVRVADDVLDDLRRRLRAARFPDEISDSGWDYGSELATVRELAAYWAEEYDWRAAERSLNRFSQCLVPVESPEGPLRMHCIHQRSPVAEALPLLITHGWPGSVWELHRVIGPLSDPGAHGGSARDAFHVVCPSLPGYGFSEAPRRAGFDVEAVARTMAALMERLGYGRYGAQGGDWGASVSAWLGRLYPERLLGLHLNLVPARRPQEDAFDGLSADELSRLDRGRRFRDEGTGYQAIQGTKPQTLGYGLHDSPVGLLGWILEKFHAWSDCDGDVLRRFDRDDLLTNVTIYWVTGTITSSMRLYCESRRSGQFGGRGPESRVEVPTACALFPAELFLPPRRWAEAAFRVEQWTEMPRGGHFAALEEPELLIEDVRKFFARYR
ncbi:MAG TPA: alpha/beta fold hydrolase [Thermoanaerobaculia bacterium]|nr:alpha/beta fold hydrolase [Thermoanaerobaculia bacterium]